MSSGYNDLPAFFLALVIISGVVVALTFPISIPLLYIQHRKIKKIIAENPKIEILPKVKVNPFPIQRVCDSEKNYAK